MDITPEGFGANAAGGAGGDVMTVTTTDDPWPAVPGTLRYAIEGTRDNDVTGPRIIEFAVAGAIHLQTPIGIKVGEYPGIAKTDRNYITIDGSTAPGDGICIDGNVSLLSHCIVHNLRFRQLQDNNYYPLALDGNNNLVDHCSFSWGGHGSISIMPHGGSDCQLTTVQHCIVAENDIGGISTHGAHNVSWHHNLFAHNNVRNPRVGSVEDQGYSHAFDIRYNVVYNGMAECIAIRDEGLNGCNVNLVGCYCKMGPESQLTRYSVVLEKTSDEEPTPPATIQLYLADWYGPHVEAEEAMWNEVRAYRVEGEPVADEETHRVEAAFEYPAVTEPDDVYVDILAGAGASPRDSVDERIVGEVEAGTGECRSSKAEIREWAELQWEGLEYGVSGRPRRGCLAALWSGKRSYYW